MKPPLYLVRVLLLICVTCLTGRTATPGAFGPGKAGLTAAGPGQAKLFSSQTRVSVRFTATHTGALTEFGFGAIPGPGFSSRQPDAFTVALHADQNGKPGAELARATKAIFNDAGARARMALFEPGVLVRAGIVYHLVIASSWADDGDHAFSVTYTRLARDVTPVNSFEMSPVDPAAAVLTSVDAGRAWAPVEQSIATHKIIIAGESQGWGYTGTLELPLKRGPGGAQYVMQTFAFRTGGSQPQVVPTGLRLSVRPQGALVGSPVKLFAHIVTPSGFDTVAEAYATVTLTDPSRFEPVTLVFVKGRTLVEGANYVLILGLAEEVTVSPADFVFLRGYNWGIGSPNLSELSWQGTGGCAYLSRTPNELGEPRPGGDVPFLIDYQQAP